MRLAAALKKAGTKAKVIDYISPQVWAWNRGRIPKMARILDLMICIFPFEKPLYEESGLKTVFVGHPMLDSLAEKRIGAGREKNLLGLFPGSREREVRKIYPGDARGRPPAGAGRARLADRGRGRFERDAGADGGDRAPATRMCACEMGVKTSHELMQRATAGMVASGTATLEAAYFGLPFVLLYKAAWLTFAIGRRLVKVKWLGMPNILADREVVREFLQEEARPAAIAEEVGRLLDDQKARDGFPGQPAVRHRKAGRAGSQRPGGGGDPGGDESDTSGKAGGLSSLGRTSRLGRLDNVGVQNSASAPARLSEAWLQRWRAEWRVYAELRAAVVAMGRRPMRGRASHPFVFRITPSSFGFGRRRIRRSGRTYLRTSTSTARNGNRVQQQRGDVLGQRLDQPARFCLGFAADGLADGRVIDGLPISSARRARPRSRDEPQGDSQALRGLALGGGDADAGQQLESADDDAVLHGRPSAFQPMRNRMSRTRFAPKRALSFWMILGLAIAVQLVVDAGLHHPDIQHAVANPVRAGVKRKPVAHDLLPGGENLAFGEPLLEAELAHHLLEGVAHGLRPVRRRGLSR